MRFPFSKIRVHYCECCDSFYPPLLISNKNDMISWRWFWIRVQEFKNFALCLLSLDPFLIRYLIGKKCVGISDEFLPWWRIFFTDENFCRRNFLPTDFLPIRYYGFYHFSCSWNFPSPSQPLFYFYSCLTGNFQTWGFCHANSG